MLPALREMQSKYPVIGDVRGRGAMLAVELVRPGTLEPDTDATAAVATSCHGEGVLVLTAGTYGNVLRFLPPLVMPRAPARGRARRPRQGVRLARRLTRPPTVRSALLACPTGEPYSTSRSRNGLGGNASGPSTPTPDQVPSASSSRATTGLIAVCQTTACEPYSAIDQALSTTWYRYTSRGLPSLPVPVTQVPGAGLAVHAVAQAGRVRQARGDDVARRDLDAADRHLLGAVQPELVQDLEHVDELVAQAVLERHALGVHPARHEEHLLVLDVHALDRPDALGEHEGLRLGERRRGEPAAALLPHHRRVEALLDRRPDREGRREV